MFIHDIPRHLINNNRLYLHPTLRSSVGIANGTNVNVALRSRNSWNVPELIVTPYAYEIWPDIWNLDLQLIDRPGQIERLFRILETCSISVLHYIARTAYKSRYHSKYLILDCSEYGNSEIDKRPVDRHVNPDFRLWGLYYNILTEFMHEVRIEYDNTPRIDLHRNVIHLNMWQDTLNKNADGITNKLEMPVSLPCYGGGITLSNDLIERLNIRRDTYCSASANTESHVVYSSILNSSNAHLVHIAIYFNKEAIQVSSIMNIFYELSLNVVRSQIVAGILGSPDNLPDSLRVCPQIATLNLMAISPVPTRREELIAKLNADSFQERSRDGTLYVELVSPHHTSLAQKRPWIKW